MKITDKRHVLKRIEAVSKIVQAEISGNRGDGTDKFAAGLSSEGFAGGYLQALNDVEAALRHGFPSDHRRYWRAADATDGEKKPRVNRLVLGDDLDDGQRGKERD